MSASRPLKYVVIQVAGLMLMLTPGATLAERLPLKPYTTADGLPHNVINKIVRDSRGFLWFCTDEGLSRYDGYTFTNYGAEQGLPHPVVNDFLETRSGELWVATNAGLVRFNPKGTPQGRVVYSSEAGQSTAPMFTVVVPDDAERNARVITVLLEGRDTRIWCGTIKHLYGLERSDGRFELRPVDIGALGKYPQQFHVLDLLEDRHGSLWIGSFSGLIRRWPDGSTERYSKSDGLPDNNIQDILEDHQGRLWAGTRLGGFFRFDGAGGPSFVTQTYTRREGLPSDWIFKIYETGDRKFWVATNKGIVEFLPDGDQSQAFLVYTRRNGLSYHEITTLSEDAGGNLWLGTNAAGAMKLAHSGFVTYDEQDGIASVNAIHQDQAGGVCFRGSVLGDNRQTVFEGAKLDLLRAGTDGYYARLGRFDGRQFEWFKPSAPYSFGWVMEQVSVQTPDGEWWVGSDEGLYRFPASNSLTGIKTARPLAIYTTKDGLAGLLVWRLFGDSAGNVWVSTSSSSYGLARWDRTSQTLRDLSSSPGLPSLKNELPTSFGEDRAGNVWVGLNSGVARYSDGRFQFFTASDGIPPGAILSTYADSAGRIWLASSRSGLIRVNNPEAEKPSFTIYSTAEGLSSDGTNTITEDLQGHIYVGTGRGLDQLDPATGRIKHFTSADGLAPGNIIASFRDRTGALWFGTHRGLSRFVTTTTAATPPPPILITSLNVAGTQQPVSALGETEISLADLEPDRNQLQIDFVGLSFTPGDVLRYQYLLNGSGKDWSFPSEQRTVNFASLAPGRYRFLVRALNSDGVASAIPATITFVVLRPFWQRWWFLTLVVLGLGWVAYVLYRSRVARIMELATVRTRIATDLHDDIGANLTKISILSEVARQQVGNGDGEKDSPLVSIARISRESVAAMSDIVWAINPHRDSLKDVIRRMRLHAEETCLPHEIELEFQAPEDLTVKLGIETRRSLYLVFKEAINNAVRHSGCWRISVVLSLNRDSLLLEVSDNGLGFDLTTERDGNGLFNMRRRAEALDGKLDVESSIGSGSTVRLRLPYSQSHRFATVRR